MRSRQAVNAAAIVAAMAMPTMAWAARQQPPVHDMAGMGQPASQAAVAECAQAQPQVLRTLEGANQRLEAARQGNSPAAMRTAVDDLQGALRQLRTLLGACAGMQAGSTADMPAGHVMPGGQPMPTPPGATDPHAGHVMPAPPQASAAATPEVQAMTTVENPAARLSDLSCQPQVDRDTAPRATHLGQAYYFCTAADRDLFLKTPAKYLQR